VDGSDSLEVGPDAGSSTVRIRRLDIRANAVVIITFASAIYLVREAASALVPIFVSLLLAHTLAPFVAYLTACRLPRLLAAIIVYLVLAVLGGAFAREAREQARRFVDDLPATVGSLQEALKHRDAEAGVFLARLRSAMRATPRQQSDRSPVPAAGLPAPGGTARDLPRVSVVPARFDVRVYLRSTWRRFLASGLDVMIVALLSFLMLTTGDLFKAKLVTLAGREGMSKRVALEVLQDIERQIQRYLLVRALISIIVAAATAVCLWTIGLEHAVAWGLVAGILNVLPIVGPCVAIGLIAIAALVQFRSIEMTAAAALLSTVVAAVEGNFITPLLTSRAGELNTVAVFIAVVFWGWAWGLWGLLLAIPITVALKAAADHIDALQPVSELLGR